MKLNKLIFTTLSMAMLSSSALIAADFDWMVNLNLSSESDPYRYKTGLSSRFGLPESQLSVIIKSVGAPADAYMVLRLAELSGRPPEYVLKQYQSKKNKGWGVIAQDLGIKPGSSGFKALKGGHDMREYEEDSKDKHSNKGHGKSKH